MIALSEEKNAVPVTGFLLAHIGRICRLRGVLQNILIENAEQHKILSKNNVTAEVPSPSFMMQVENGQL